MKYHALIILFLALNVNLWSQAFADSIYVNPEVPAEFLEGEKVLIERILGELHLPYAVRENGINTNVLISYVVDAEGKMTGMKVEQDPGYGCGDEAQRVMAPFFYQPLWEAAWDDGKRVASRNYLTIPFRSEPAIVKDFIDRSDQFLDYTHFNKGVLLMDKKRYRKAARIFGKYIKAEADDGDGYLRRGECYYRLKKIDKACADWQIAKEKGSRKEARKLLKKYCE